MGSGLSHQSAQASPDASLAVGVGTPTPPAPLGPNCSTGSSSITIITGTGAHATDMLRMALAMPTRFARSAVRRSSAAVLSAD